jgi:hypothetical protein
MGWLDSYYRYKLQRRAIYFTGLMMISDFNPNIGAKHFQEESNDWHWPASAPDNNGPNRIGAYKGLDTIDGLRNLKKLLGRNPYSGSGLAILHSCPAREAFNSSDGREVQVVMTAPS